MKKEHIKVRGADSNGIKDMLQIPVTNYDSDNESKNGNDSLSKLTKRERDDSDSSSDESPPPEPVKKQKGSNKAIEREANLASEAGDGKSTSDHTS